MNEIAFFPDWDTTAPARKFRVVQPEDERIPVIVAEDDPVSRRLLTAILDASGFRTIVTSDGLEAMSALRAQSKPCVALIDWMMPGMDGAEICRRARESEKPVYFIMLSVRTDKEDTVQAFREGADDFMAKPVHRDELVARIRAGLTQLEYRAALQSRVASLERTSATGGQLVKFEMPL